ncbi:glycosyltransferase family 1 protein [Thermomonas sp.]|uniref:glycosyltransferase family 4 protein n=1 Tax=Thermomonas sp. TaxID=1971895 RepID=UPI00248A6E30|nr:glycosyltransferase family 1 protein [Thermomonas sp.]MDI1253501.1 glycosyltransferase family 1 protein [Thermomonas sp.]
MDAPGSMRAYADVLIQALARHAPDVEAQLFELAPVAASGGLDQRMEMLSLPLKAWRHRNASVDVWHVLDGSRAYLASALQGAPLVITAHDIIPRLQQRGRFPGTPTVSAAARWLWRRNGVAMRSAQMLVCVSECTRRDVSSEYGDPHSSKVVPSPVRPSLAAFSEVDGSPREQGVILHVGNNGFYKKREQALRIFARLDRALARTLVMIGPKPTASMRAFAEQAGLAASILWIEDVADTVMVDWYRRASVLVFPSLYEGFGWPVLEAMTFGLPVVCSDGGSLPEVAGSAAPCVPADDIDGFVHEIEVLLRDPELVRRRAEQGRDWAAQFSLERFARDMADTYRSARNDFGKVKR